jgi:outer membrane biosynthesis protein TonB
MAQLEGTVSLDVEVGTDGNVISVRASGAHKLLQKASEENVRQWVFERSPDKEGAILRGEVVYTYKLEGKAEYYDSAPTVTLDLPSRVLIVARPAEVQP